MEWGYNSGEKLSFSQWADCYIEFSGSRFFKRFLN